MRCDRFIRFGTLIPAIVFSAAAYGAAPWRTDAAAARADALKAGKPCVLILNSNTRALCGHIQSVEATLQPAQEIIALREKAVLAVSRKDDADAAGLRGEFGVVGLYTWIVVLDGKGETLASYMADSTGLPCAEESKAVFPGLVAQRISKALEEKASLQALERAWRANPADAEALDALAKRYLDCSRPRVFADLCEKELAHEKQDAPTRNRLRLYRFLAKTDPFYAFGGGDPERKPALRAEAESLLFEFPTHPKAVNVEAALFETYASSATFDVPGKIAAVAAKLRARAKDSADPAGVEQRAKALEERAALWKREAQTEAAKKDHDIFIDVRLGDAKRTLEQFGGDERSRAYYKELLDEARAKLEHGSESK
ncbi:MAG: hypothetical protein HY291_03190 [Planctomycetes bacterium]|nr:hypothetical protein [Planctomycetota bacterium]